MEKCHYCVWDSCVWPKTGKIPFPPPPPTSFKYLALNVYCNKYFILCCNIWLISIRLKGGCRWIRKIWEKNTVLIFLFSNDKQIQSLILYERTYYVYMCLSRVLLFYIIYERFLVLFKVVLLCFLPLYFKKTTTSCLS